MSSENKTVSLVLGSGGARGHAHIGAIRAIEERGFDVRHIAGTSMGALIGGIYATGKLDIYNGWALRLKRNDVMRLLDFSFTWTSVFKGERIFDVLAELVGDGNIENLERGFTAVATSLNDQREIWINKGPLFPAIRASSAVPGAFSPVRLGRRILVDGGLVNPIPIAPTLSDGTDLTIAVNLNDNTETYRSPEPALEDAENDENNEGYGAAISRFVSNLLEDDEAEEANAADPDFRDVLTRSFDVMQGSIARMKLAAYSPDIVVNIPREACSFFEFYRAAEMAELGYRQTTAALEKNGH